MENRFYKIGQDGGSYVTAHLFNPITGEEETICVRDYDYSDCSRDNDEVYYMEIDEEALRIWKHKHGRICEGDEVEVVKGRKLPKGLRGNVKAFKEIYDRYGRCQATYAILEDGNATNTSNLKLIKAN